MKLFISWSGPLSQQVADTLRDWIPSILQSVNPFMSATDVDKGARWTVNISQELEDADYGIICVTPDNIGSPWLNFEAGAISKSIEKGRVSPFLFGVASSDITGPLVQFQHTVYNRPDVFQLVKGINSACPNPIPDTRLLGVFDVWWPRLKEPLDAIKAPPKKGSSRTSEDMLAELIDLVRRLQKIEEKPPASTASAGMDAIIETTKVNSVEVTYLNKIEVSVLLARLQALADSISQPSNLAASKIVQLQGLVAVLVKQLSPMVGIERYDTYLRSAQGEFDQEVSAGS